MAARPGPPGETGGTSAEELLAAVRVHADRVHDAVRRLGCRPSAALEVVETSALELVDELADRPDEVGDPVGWWFRRARELGLPRAGGAAGLPLGGGLLAEDDEQPVLAEALDRLPEPQRFAVLLRDSYDLSDAAVATALGTDPDDALAAVGRARLALLPLVDGEPAPAVPAHLSDLAALARVAEGEPVRARDATARRHALSCRDCRAVTDAQQRAHLLLGGVVVAALAEADRDAVLGRVEGAARAALPATAALLPLRERAEEPVWVAEEPGRLFSPLLVLLSVALAALVGLGIGALLVRAGADDETGSGATPTDALLISPPPSPVAGQVSPPTLSFPAPRTTVFTVPPPAPPPPPSPSPSPSPTASAAPLGITVDPPAGPNGAQLTVQGTGWTPGAEVSLDYLDPTGTPTGAQGTATVGPDGRFTAELAAQDPAALPGEHVVRARDGEVIAEATYDAAP